MPAAGREAASRVQEARRRSLIDHSCPCKTLSPWHTETTLERASLSLQRERERERERGQRGLLALARAVHAWHQTKHATSVTRTNIFKADLSLVYARSERSAKAERTGARSEGSGLNHCSTSPEPSSDMLARYFSSNRMCFYGKTLWPQTLPQLLRCAEAQRVLLLSPTVRSA